MKRYFLRWKFYLYTIDFEVKEVQQREECFDKFEDLLKCYREKKNALFSGCINYNKDFEVYTAVLQQQDISKLDDLL